LTALGFITVRPTLLDSADELIEQVAPLPVSEHLLLRYSPDDRLLTTQSGQSNGGRDPFEFSPPVAN
jgi:hypothetical protein